MPDRPTMIKLYIDKWEYYISVQVQDLNFHDGEAQRLPVMV